ncbi:MULTISPECIES: hypothetical protein [Brucella/Ochrobactrum group]|uniref:hypothetical protein n=1 Tax=Brucella/Ochrobactrum group TaxID=2826938 RepID=UPI0015E815CA|nr:MULTISPECIES: hypothetical protein [Brucella]WHS32773.1 hypothetical protein QLQ09_10505 [Brucella sp. NM4]
MDRISHFYLQYWPKSPDRPLEITMRRNASERPLCALADALVLHATCGFPLRNAAHVQAAILLLLAPVMVRMTDFFGRSNFLSSGQFMIPEHCQQKCETVLRSEMRRSKTVKK